MLEEKPLISKEKRGLEVKPLCLLLSCYKWRWGYFICNSASLWPTKFVWNISVVSNNTLFFFCKTRKTKLSRWLITTSKCYKVPPGLEAVKFNSQKYSSLYHLLCLELEFGVSTSDKMPLAFDFTACCFFFNSSTVFSKAS